MKLSARKEGREPSGGLRRLGPVVLVTATAVLVMLADLPPVLARVPLPQPRPTEAPRFDAQKSEPASNDKQEAREPAEPPPPSACRLALTSDVAVAPSVPPIHGPGACGGDDLVRLEAIMLPDNRRVPLNPGGVMRCTMARAVADWIRSDMAPLAASLGTTVAELDNFDSFDCRGRNRVVGAKLSEHGKANALDLRGIKFANGVTLALTDRAASREAREKVLASVCARFTTVLGPGSDGYHEDHIHIDLAERRNGYRICQWNLYDPMPVVAPAMPAQRPDDAPPREIAEAKPETPVPSPQPPAAPLPAERPELRGAQDGAPAVSGADTVPLPTPSPRRTAQFNDAPKTEAALPPKRKVKRRRFRSPFDDWFR